MFDTSLIAVLGYIQDVIKRMAANSLLIKGWCISLTGIIIALGKKDYVNDYLVQIFLGVIVFNLFFSLLDCYYLQKERIFINEYNKKVRELTDGEIKNNLTIISTDEVKTGFLCVYFSASVWPFYALIIIVSYVIARGCL